MYLGQASLTDYYINIEVTLNQATMLAVRLLRWRSEPELAASFRDGGVHRADGPVISREWR